MSNNKDFCWLFSSSFERSSQVTTVLAGFFNRVKVHECLRSLLTFYPDLPIVTTIPAGFFSCFEDFSFSFEVAAVRAGFF
jgi:hypothetical protein